jgi:hypothetical protein
MKVLSLKSGSVLSMALSVSGISVGHGNSDAPAGPTNGNRRTTLGKGGASWRTPAPLNRPRAALLQFLINQPWIAGGS